LASVYWDYFVLVMVAAFGVIQSVVTRNGLTGLSLFRGRRRLADLFGGVFVALAYGWFFTSGDRNIPGLEGFQLFYMFLVGVLAALLLTLILTSLVNAAYLGRADAVSADGTEPVGLERLRHRTYFQAWTSHFWGSPRARALRRMRERTLLGAVGLIDLPPGPPTGTGGPSNSTGVQLNTPTPPPPAPTSRRGGSPE